MDVTIVYDHKANKSSNWGEAYAIWTVSLKEESFATVEFDEVEFETNTNIINKPLFHFSCINGINISIPYWMFFTLFSKCVIIWVSSYYQVSLN